MHLFLWPIWPQTFSHTQGTSLSLLLLDSAALEKELYRQQWRVLCWTVILFKQNSFDASLKPHYNHDRAKWTLIDMVCSQLVQGGGGAWLLAQSSAWLRIFIFTLFSFSSLLSILPHCPHHPRLHTCTLWFQKCWPLSEPASLAHQVLTTQHDMTGRPSNAAVK